MWSTHNENWAYISPLEDISSFYSESEDNSSSFWEINLKLNKQDINR